MTKAKTESCVVLFFFFLLILGCSQHLSNDRHAEYFDPVIKKLDTTNRTKINEALASFDSAFYAFPNPSPGDIYSYDSAKAYSLGWFAYDYVKAFAYNDSMLAIAQNNLENETYTGRYAAALYTRAMFLLNVKKYDEAFQYFQLSQQTFLLYQKDKCSINRYPESVGNLMFNQQKYVLAAGSFLRQYEELGSSCNTDARFLITCKIAMLTNVGLSYLRAGLLDSASFYQNEALKLNEKKLQLFPGEFNYAAIVYADVGEVLFQRGEYAEAEGMYKKSIVGTAKVNRGYTQLTQARLAELYLKTGKRELLKTTLVKLKQSLDTLDSEDQRMKWLSLKSRYFQLHDQIDSAFFYLKQFDDQKDSIDKRDLQFASIDVSSAIENADLKNFNVELQRKGKLKNLFIAVAIFVVIMAGTIALLVWYNLKRTRKLNMQVQQKNNELERAFSSLEQSYAENNRLMRIVAHDLKNPISAMQNIMYSLLQKEQPGNDKEMFHAIQASCGSSLSLIHDLLEEKKEQIKKGQKLIDIGNVLENCVQLLQAKADEKKQLLTLQVDHVDILMNRQKIWRVMNNIINNAIKFSPVRSSIDIRLQKKKNVVLFSVVDNGIGIPDNLKEKIFDPSASARRAGTEGEASHGLGLSISKKIVEEHEGRLWFESKEGVETTFYVELPIAGEIAL